MKEYLLIGLLLFSVAVLAQTPDEDYADAVILSSDNDADMTAAEAASEQSGASIIPCPWGEDNETALEAVIAKNPSKVIIIGGTAAIPDALEQRLRIRLMERNITIIRVMGQDRYETAAEIAGHFWSNVSDAVIIQGDDTMEMKKRILEAKQNRLPVLYMKNNGIPDFVKQKLISWKMPKARMYLAPDTNETAIDKDLEDTELRNVSKTRNNHMERAREMLEKASEAISIAEERINVTDDANSTTIAGSRLLVLAKQEYERANESFEEGNYGRAFGQTVAARVHAIAAVKVRRNVLAGDYARQVERVRNEISEKGIESVRETARKELIEQRERKIVRAVVRAGRQSNNE